MKRLCHQALCRMPAGVPVVFILMAVFCGCGGESVLRQKAEPKLKIETLLVVPFVDQCAIHGENEIYRCGLCGGMFNTSAVEKGADVFVSKTIVRILTAENSVQLVDNTSVEAVRMQLLQDRKRTLTDLEMISEIGKALGADAVLTGSVYKWIERAGSNYAADSPASVGIDIDLVDTKTARLLWHTRFDESQQFLLDNLLTLGTFIKRGGKWVTAEQLAADGLKDVLERSPIP